MELPAAVAEWLVGLALFPQSAVLSGRGDAVRLDDETTSRFETGTVRGPARRRRAGAGGFDRPDGFCRPATHRAAPARRAAAHAGAWHARQPRAAAFPAASGPGLAAIH
jgi:hypothetical protein